MYFIIRKINNLYVYGLPLCGDLNGFGDQAFYEALPSAPFALQQIKGITSGLSITLQGFFLCSQGQKFGPYPNGN